MRRMTQNEQNTIYEIDFMVTINMANLENLSKIKMWAYITIRLKMKHHQWLLINKLPLKLNVHLSQRKSKGVILMKILTSWVAH